VMMQLCQYMAQRFPQEKINFLIACGPDDLHPEGLKRADFIEEFGDFRGVNGNAQVQVVATASLRDLALLTRHSVLALSNDTGPGHIAGALRIPTITPYLPGNIYSLKVWSSTLWHRGITLEPSPFSYQQIEAAVLWDRTHIIDSIPPEQLLEEAVKSLASRMQTR
jgi:ADP-heptose:LPS heptosyltransferase